MKLYFYTKKQCPLCEKGLSSLKLLKDNFDFIIEEVDIYDDDRLLELYQIRIPVITDDKGIVLDEGILSSFTLKQKIEDIQKMREK